MEGEPPFTFEPTTGHLEPGESARVHCEFTPVDATVNVCNAVCSVQPAHDFHDGMKPLVRRDVRAVGKYPFVRLSDKDLDFGEVLVGKTVEMSVKLLNQSVVPVTYACERVEAEHDHVFAVGARAASSRALRRDVLRPCACSTRPRCRAPSPPRRSDSPRPVEDRTPCCGCRVPRSVRR